MDINSLPRPKVIPDVPTPTKQYYTVHFIIVGIMGIVLLCISAADLIKHANMAAKGVLAEASITSYEPTTYTDKEGETHTVHWHRISYDGHSAKVKLDKKNEKGAKIHVYYLPGKTDEVIVSDNMQENLVNKSFKSNLPLIILGFIFMPMGIIGFMNYRKINSRLKKMQ